MISANVTKPCRFSQELPVGSSVAVLWLYRISTRLSPQLMLQISDHFLQQPILRFKLLLLRRQRVHPTRRVRRPRRPERVIRTSVRQITLQRIYRIVFDG